MTPQQLIERGYLPDGDYRKLSTLGNLGINFVKGNIKVHYSLNYVDVDSDGKPGHNPPCIETIYLYKGENCIKYIQTAWERFHRKPHRFQFKDGYMIDILKNIKIKV